MYKIVSDSTFYLAYLDVAGLFPYSEFVGFYEPNSNWECYLSEDKLSGFAITKEKELVNLFNSDKHYKMLDDPEVVKIINEKVDWFVCLGYYGYQTNGAEFSIPQKSLTEYYKAKLNFDVFGYTNSDTEDMIENIGLGHTVSFVRKYGIPFQTFLINKKYPVVNPGYYGDNEYKIIKKNILTYIDTNKSMDA